MPGTPSLCRAGRGPGRVGGWVSSFSAGGWQLGPGFSATRTCLQRPRPLGGLLKGQCQKQRRQPHQNSPLETQGWPLLLCASGRSFGGTPRWEVGWWGGGGAGPSPGTGCDMQHISLGPIPTLPLRLFLGEQPGRFGGGRRGGCLGTLGKPENLLGRKSGTGHRESSQE